MTCVLCFICEHHIYAHVNYIHLIIQRNEALVFLNKSTIRILHATILVLTVYYFLMLLDLKTTSKEYTALYENSLGEITSSYQTSHSVLGQS